MSTNELFINYLKENHASTFEDLYNQFESKSDKCPICLEIVEKKSSIHHGSHVLSCVKCFPEYVRRHCYIGLNDYSGIFDKRKIECCVCRGSCDNGLLENEYHYCRLKEVVKCKKINSSDNSTIYFNKVKQGKKMATYQRVWIGSDGKNYTNNRCKFNRSHTPSKGDVIKIKKFNDTYDMYVVV